jgi:Short C-terminal domain
MEQLTQAGEQAVQDLAQRYRVSVDAVKTLLVAVSAGGGSMAQFYVPELGGGGQWMRGGMTMVGDMFNSGLQATVSGLCSELSALLGSQRVFAPPPPRAYGASAMISPGNAWWPTELGSPSSSGGQNNARYAYFPQARRLAIDTGGQIAVYDTLDHQIGGVQQQQGGSYGLSFTSQFGTFTVDTLPLAGSTQGQGAQDARNTQPSPPSWQSPPPAIPDGPAPAATQGGHAPPSGPLHSQQDILAALERLGHLHQRGVLSDDEFKSKKAELLARL